MLGKQDPKSSKDKKQELEAKESPVSTADEADRPPSSAKKPRKKSLIAMFTKLSKRNSLTPANDATNDNQSDTDSIGAGRSSNIGIDKPNMNRRASNISIISDVGNKVGRRMSQAISEVDWKEVNTCMQQTF